MSDFDLQIKIAANIADAVDKIASLGKAFKELGTSVKAIGPAVKQSLDQTSKSLDGFSKSTKKLGRDFSVNVTAPIAALAGLSLKKIFDDATAGGGTASMNKFAASVQTLKSAFDDLLRDVGTQLAPVFTKVADVLTNLINIYRNLSPETKSFINTIAGIAAAVGPLLLGLSSIAGLLAKLWPIIQLVASGFSALVGFLTSPAALIAAIGVAVAGLINVFIKLKASGESTFGALTDVLKLAATGFAKYIGGTMIKAISKLMEGAGAVVGFFNKEWGQSIKNGAKFVQGFSDDIDKEFNAVKGGIDKKLAKIGTSTGEAFTFGFSKMLDGMFDNVTKPTNKKLKLNPDVVAQMVDREALLKEIESREKAHNLTLEELELEHQKALQGIDSAADPMEGVEERMQKEREFLERRFAIQTADLERTLQQEEAKAQAIADIHKRREALLDAQVKRESETAKLAQEQELASTKLTNQQIEEAYRLRYEKVKQYADLFASGLSSAFVEIASGQEKLGRSLEKFAGNFIKQVGEMILRATLLKTIMNSLGLGSATAAGFSEGGEVLKKADGGLISGPGSGTSDSIPARLSNGEFVMTAAAVKAYGSRFFDNINAAARGGKTVKSQVGRYADGGLVTSSGQAPQVVIQNKGSDKQVQGQSYDPVTAVTTVILDDVSKNGSISKAFQATFGVKRGGFR